MSQTPYHHTVEEESTPGWAAGLGAILVLAGAVLLVYVAVTVIQVLRNPDGFRDRLDRMEATIRGDATFASMSVQVDGVIAEAVGDETIERERSSTATQSDERVVAVVHPGPDGRGEVLLNLARPGAVIVYVVLFLLLGSLSKGLISAGAKLMVRKWRFNSSEAREQFRNASRSRDSDDIPTV